MIYRKVKRSRKRQSALVDDAKYTGGPCDLPTCQPCTWREIINYYYYLKMHNMDLDNQKIFVIMNKQIKHAWSVSYPTLTLLSDMKVTKKVRSIITKVVVINAKKGKTINAKMRLYPKLDTLFDISACVCDLPDKKQCNDRYFIFTQRGLCTSESIKNQAPSSGESKLFLL